MCPTFCDLCVDDPEWINGLRYLVLWTAPCYRISQVDCGSCYHVLLCILSLNSSILLSFTFTINVYNYYIYLMNFYAHNVYVIIIIIRHSPIHYANKPFIASLCK